jgi:hypothetical protein
MNAQLLNKKIKKIEEELYTLKHPQPIFPKIQVDDTTLENARKALFDFDIDEFVTKKDVERWKS